MDDQCDSSETVEASKSAPPAEREPKLQTVILLIIATISLIGVGLAIARVVDRDTSCSEGSFSTRIVSFELAGTKSRFETIDKACRNPSVPKEDHSPPSAEQIKGDRDVLSRETPLIIAYVVCLGFICALGRRVAKRRVTRHLGSWMIGAGILAAR